jgi:hypothetical protein
MFTRKWLEKDIGKPYAERIESFVKELCDDYREEFGELPGENVGLSMIQLFDNTLCDYTKEKEPDVDCFDTFDPTDFHTVCRLGGLCNLPPIHS